MKIFKNIAFCALLASLPAAAQNTATQNGNWNDCATWGNPTSIIQNATDTKTINTGVTVTQNTAWSAGNLTLNGTGAVAFASAANSVDFVTDTGNDQSCGCVLPTVTSSVSSSSGNFIELNTTSTFTVTSSNANYAVANVYFSDGTSYSSTRVNIASSVNWVHNNIISPPANNLQLYVIFRFVNDCGTVFSERYDFTVQGTN